MPSESIVVTAVKDGGTTTVLDFAPSLNGIGRIGAFNKGSNSTPTLNINISWQI